MRPGEAGTVGSGTVGALPAPVVPGALRAGPRLATVVNRLAQVPGDLLADQVAPGAALSDLAVLLDGSVLDRATLAAVDADLRPGTERTGLALLTAWVLAAGVVRTHPGVRAAAADAGGASVLLLRVVERVPRVLAGLRPPRAWVAEVEPREELARAVLAVAGMRPHGEDDARAADAWAAVSTAHRQQVFAQMTHERQRAEELAARLAEKRAKEAAAQYANY